jgi:cytochrome c peroxidase
MSASAIRGMALFLSKRLQCSQCHSGPFFSKGTQSSDLSSDNSPYRNNGLYNLHGKGDYPWPNIGLNEFTHKPEDMGKFRIPSLRNVALTGPYMHDGSISSLEKVLEHYAAGGRTIKSGPYAGVGAKNPYKDPKITGFSLSEQEKKDVISFLKALTDHDFIKNPRFSDPWLSKTP